MLYFFVEQIQIVRKCTQNNYNASTNKIQKFSCILNDFPLSYKALQSQDGVIIILFHYYIPDVFNKWYLFTTYKSFTFY